eukprot:gene6838-8481_t
MGKKKIKIEYEKENNSFIDDDSDNDLEEDDETNINNKNKRKLSIKSETTTDQDKPISHLSSYHEFSQLEIESIRSNLLKWYDQNKRTLPWRYQQDQTIDANERNKRAYQTWVSEIMLQQTRVVSVIDYFKKWMDKWPTINDLANSTLEEVNELWSGLGYYRRAKNLFEGSKFIKNTMNGIMPDTIDGLIQIPGIGNYTAGAIASIAFGKKEPLVDGNVIRVLSRVRSIGANPKKSQTSKLHWKLAKDLVDPNRPGDFNQSLMELGATICVIKSPLCSQCPVKDNCQSFIELELNQQGQKSNTTKIKSQNSITNYFTKIKKDDDLDSSSTTATTLSTTTTTTTTTTSIPTTTNGFIKSKVESKNINGSSKNSKICDICDCFEDTDGPTESVTRYPKKVVKLKPRNENVNVFLIRYIFPKDDKEKEKEKEKEKYLIVQRPDKGLLASLWEAPSFIDQIDENEEEENDDDEDEGDKPTKSKKSKKSKIPKKNQEISESFVNNTVLPKYILNSKKLVEITSLENLGNITHKFSHIHQELQVYLVQIANKNGVSQNLETVKNSRSKWVPKSEIGNVAIANQMMKCFELDQQDKTPSNNRRRTRST